VVILRRLTLDQHGPGSAWVVRARIYTPGGGSTMPGLVGRPVAQLTKLVTSWAVAAHGTSSGRGVFLVRDSIYEGPASDVYDYDPSRTGDEAPYAAAIIERDASWLKLLANHLVQITWDRRGR
jgi:hypothetical protein